MPSLNPYLSFRDNAREAMEFYQSVFGGDLNIMTFENFDMGQDPSENNLVMHAQLTSPDGFVLMGSDTPSTMSYVTPAGFSVSLSGDDEDRFTGFWEALAAGGSVEQPFEAPPWGGRFGMLVDKFGVNWMVSVSTAQE